MSEQDKHEQLRRQLKLQSARMKKAEQERPTLLAQTVYVGTLGLLFVLPVVGGAYLGHWLDNMASGYSTRWTISLIITGVVVGMVNVFIFIRNES